MRFGQRITLSGIILGLIVTCCPNAPAQDANVPTIKTETRLVLVDTVVTDKKGNYIRDLTAQNFKVWEDDKEQPISSFSFEETNASQKQHYLVLFFDNSTMDFGDQAKAREAATKFIDANSGPNYLIAVVDFGGTLHVAQNFTADTERLKQVVSGAKTAQVSPNGEPVQIASVGAPTGLPSLSRAEANFGVYTALLALRNLAKSLADVPGRKTLVMLTAGFSVNAEQQSQLTAVIDACNKANVAIYPIDVRGLVVGSLAAPRKTIQPVAARSHSPVLRSATLQYTGNTVPQPHLLLVQRGPGGGPRGGPPGGTGGPRPPGGGGTRGGPPGGGARGPAGGGAQPSRYYNPNFQPRQIVPPFPTNASTNQQVLYALADGTGGFVIRNTNDLLGGLQKIGKEQSEYYSLGYTPAVSPEGSCHTLKVKVDRGGTIVRARSGYCNVRPKDLLAGNAVEKELETRATGEMAGNVTASMQAPFFYTSPNTARVNLALDIPTDSIKFEKVKGKEHAAINILGIAYKPDGAIAARFSNTVDLDYEKNELKEFQKHPYHYDDQFEVASGQYNLRVVFSSGNEAFGKIQFPLNIDPYDGKQFSISGLALSNDLRRVSDEETSLDADLLEDKKPLMTQGVQIIPSGSNRFKTTDNAVVYVEVYDPLLLTDKPPKFALQIKITDRKSGAEKMNAGFTNTEPSIRPGNPVVPLGVKLPLISLPTGSYRVEIRAVDAAGHSTPSRSADFELE